MIYYNCRNYKYIAIHDIIKVKRWNCRKAISMIFECIIEIIIAQNYFKQLFSIYIHK